MLLIGLVCQSIEKTQAGQFITRGTMEVGACCSRSDYVWRNKSFHICMTTVARYKCSSKPIPSIHSLPAVNICTIAKGCWTVAVKETLTDSLPAPLSKGTMVTENCAKAIGFTTLGKIRKHSRPNAQCYNNSFFLPTYPR